MRALVYALALVAAGCFTPSFDSGKLKCSVNGSQCPPGFGCIDGLCWKHGSGPSGPDLAVPDLGAPDDLAGMPAGPGGGMPTMTQQTGSACSSGTQCVTGFCADGVCCDQACDGVCVACNLINSVGNCSPVPHGNTSATLGHPACTPTAAAQCGFDGTCDGQGACSYFAAGTSCKPSSCAAGVLTPTSTCDGKGSCVTPKTLSCAPYQCQDTSQCWSSCTTAMQSSQCAGNNSCSMSGSCGPKPNGLPCSADGECANGHCADGVCCDGACTGTCEKCNLANSNGTCTPVSGAAAHGSCAGYGTTCGSACNGSNRTACVFTGAGTGCNDGQSCTYNDTCDGNGKCAGTAITPTCTSRNTTCASYSCNGTATCAVAYNTSGCSDGNDCTYNDTCNGAGTCAGTPVTCPGTDTCYTWACNGTSSCVSTGYASRDTFCGQCHCGDLKCNGAGSCNVEDGCQPAGTDCR